MEPLDLTLVDSKLQVLSFRWFIQGLRKAVNHQLIAFYTQPKVQTLIIFQVNYCGKSPMPPSHLTLAKPEGWF